MATISATEAKQRFAAVLDQAQREPISICRHGRTVAVLLSAEDFLHMRQLRVAELTRLTEQSSRYAASQGLTPSMLDELLKDNA